MPTDECGKLKPMRQKQFEENSRLKMIIESIRRDEVCEMKHGRWKWLLGIWPSIDSHFLAPSHFGCIFGPVMIAFILDALLSSSHARQPSSLNFHLLIFFLSISRFCSFLCHFSMFFYSDIVILVSSCFNLSLSVFTWNYVSPFSSSSQYFFLLLLHLNPFLSISLSDFISS